MSQQIPEGYRESTWKDEGLCLFSGEVFAYRKDGISKIEIKLNGAFRKLYHSVAQAIATPIEKAPAEFTEVFEWDAEGYALTPIEHYNVSELCENHLDPKPGDRFVITVKKLPKEGDNQ